MKVAPEIYRQRMYIEGIYRNKLSPRLLKKFLIELSKEIEMTIIFGPLVKNLAGKLNPIHNGYECFLIWAESGAQLYIWNKPKLFTLDIYTCKKFDPKKAMIFTKKFFNTNKFHYKEI